MYGPSPVRKCVVDGLKRSASMYPAYLPEPRLGTMLWFRRQGRPNPPREPPATGLRGGQFYLLMVASGFVIVAAAGALGLGKLGGGFALIKEFYPRNDAHQVTAADVAKDVQVVKGQTSLPRRSTITSSWLTSAPTVEPSSLSIGSPSRLIRGRQTNF